ncbi:hypothetical protein OIU34_23330 [Pararhizobium sp. BT-229]|uniref:hypothetical protein n=1 Tax=Pararhizobium sp. BT-229 TaxID=2986923 RepID=UPI0021F738F8|nr:hypothetical protein [Pararhizobium sp. BT-229]MCV9964829.1 hypothetical protein [Pararhizobium sp. BT-229]
MTEAISKDQAVTAMILWEKFLEAAAKDPAAENFLTAYTESNARYAMIEMAKEADAVFALLPPSEQDRMTVDGFFHGVLTDLFDYGSGQVPRLKQSHQEIADWFVESFAATRTSSAIKAHP